jgi:hypothetical protein
MNRIGTRGLTIVATLALLCPGALAGGDWNDAQIAWKDYKEGLAAAERDGKPVCLVFYTEWCPHCTNYARVFHDPEVVKRSKQFVMVRVDKDKNKELSGKYAPDGEYIPRTYFLSSKGALDAENIARSDRFKYFYDEKDPASLLSGMDRALPKRQAPPAKAKEKS